MRYRVRIDVPNGEKSQVYFGQTRKTVLEILRRIVDAGLPKGTTWQVYESKEETIAAGKIE